MLHSRLGLIAAAALCLGSAGTAGAQTAQRLTAENFVDVGDSVVDILDSSGLALANMVVGAARNAGGPVNTKLDPSPPRPNRETVVTPCPGGGSIDLVTVDQDGSGDLSPHDTFTLTFKACSIEGSLVTGGSEFNVASHRFEGTSEITELEFQFKGMGTPDLRWTGHASATMRHDLVRGTESYTVVYRNLLVTRKSSRMRWNFTHETVRPPFGNSLVRVQGKMSYGALALDLRQQEAFVVEAGPYAVSGLLSAADSHGARLEVEAGKRRYSYRFYKGGNAGDRPDSSSQSKARGAS
jgi:hypothetical protein